MSIFFLLPSTTAPLSSRGSSHCNSSYHPGGLLLSNLYLRSLPSTNFPLSPPLPRCVSSSPQASSAEPASAPEKTADNEESKASSEEKTEDERNRTESPSTKSEPSANSKESTFKQAELPSSHTSPKSEWATVLCCRFYSSASLFPVYLIFLFLPVILSGFMQRHGEVLRKR